MEYLRHIHHTYDICCVLTKCKTNFSINRKHSSTRFGKMILVIAYHLKRPIEPSNEHNTFAIHFYCVKTIKMQQIKKP